MVLSITGCVLLVLVRVSLAADNINKDVSIVDADRSIDITSQVVKVTSKITLQNNGKTPIGFFLYAVEPKNKQHVSYISGSTVDGKAPLKIVPTKVQGRDSPFWRIILREDLKPGKKLVVEVEALLTNSLTPFPAAIVQKEKQLILFKGNLYLYSPYAVAKQSTTVIAKTKSFENFTKHKPYTQSDGTIVYGPHENVAPFTTEIFSVHYENNSPFLVVTSLERVIEVSHWGNVAVEETISLEHKGAALKGSFSRYEFQRDSQSGQSSVKSFKTVLPASARDVYYRDDIGNISTSHLRVLSDSIELDLRPRFPIFGGWKTIYILGYNLPSYEYLYHSGNNFILKMRLLDHIYDDMVVAKLTTKVILPEGVHSIKVKTPYPVERLPIEKHLTYLDTTGRPVVVLRMKNLVESHIQDLEVAYTFPRILMFQEPLLAIAGFFILFIVGIICVRLDLSLSKSSRAKKEN